MGIDPDDIRRWARRGRSSSSAPAAAPAPPARAAGHGAPPGDPPAGYGWVMSAVGWALIPLGPGAAPPPLIMAPPPGYTPDPGEQSNVIPISKGSRRMLRPIIDKKRGGIEVDTYREFLDGEQMLPPQAAPGFWSGLVPRAKDVNHLQEMRRASTGAWDGYPATAWRGRGDAKDVADDPTQDAYGARGARSHVPDEGEGDDGAR